MSNNFVKSPEKIIFSHKPLLACDRIFPDFMLLFRENTKFGDIKTGDKKMNEKAAEFKHTTSSANWKEILKNCVVWVVSGLVLELSGSDLSAAPTSFALVSGLSRKRAVPALFGGALGALLKGFPTALTGLSALIIAVAAKIIPDFGKPKIRAAISAFSAAIACYFSRTAQTSSTSELLMLIISSITAGIFAFCVSSLENAVSERGFNISEPQERAAVIVITALGFFSLGQLDYAYFNVGRFLLGLMILCLTARKGLALSAVSGLSAVFGLCASNNTLFMLCFHHGGCYAYHTNR